MYPVGVLKHFAHLKCIFFFCGFLWKRASLQYKARENLISLYAGIFFVCCAGNFVFFFFKAHYREKWQWMLFTSECPIIVSLWFCKLGRDFRKAQFCSQHAVARPLMYLPLMVGDFLLQGVPTMQCSNIFRPWLAIEHLHSREKIFLWQMVNSSRMDIMNKGLEVSILITPRE